MDYSQITRHLLIAAHPGEEAADLLRELNVRLVISMIFHKPATVYTREPFQLLVLRTFDSPFLPIPLAKLERGVRAALPLIQSGDSVLVYCRKGRHRSVVMAACILIGMGYPADEAIALIKQRRPIADPDAWYIQRRILAFEEHWRMKQG